MSSSTFSRGRWGRSRSFRQRGSRRLEESISGQQLGYRRILGTEDSGLTGAAAGASAGGAAGAAAGAAGCACAAGVTLIPFSPPTDVLPSVPLVMPRFPPRFCAWPSAPIVIPAFSLNCSDSLVAFASPAFASPSAGFAAASPAGGAAASPAGFAAASPACLAASSPCFAAASPACLAASSACLPAASPCC